MRLMCRLGLHGLRLNLQSKKHGKLRQMDAPTFRQKCREYANEQSTAVKISSVCCFGNWKNPYRTMDFKFERHVARAGKNHRTRHLHSAPTGGIGVLIAVRHWPKPNPNTPIKFACGRCRLRRDGSKILAEKFGVEVAMRLSPCRSGRPRHGLCLPAWR